jgi:antitoxin (DNA-binding transcriptional repressor) of toxin-antitoxin stability system
LEILESRLDIVFADFTWPVTMFSGEASLSGLFRIAMSDSYNAKKGLGMQVSVAEAKNRLPALIKRAESGERVTICRRGKPVAELVRSRVEAKKPKLGTMRGKMKILDPDWWKPMTEEETEAF